MRTAIVGASQTPIHTAEIMVILSARGASAGAVKCPRALRMPMLNATNPTRRTYGNMMRVK